MTTDTFSSDDILRVEVFKDGLALVVLGIGELETIDSSLMPHYDSVDDLPSWVQERIAILLMMDPTPPTHHVEGVGRRISKNVFWVLPPYHANFVRDIPNIIKGMLK